MSDRRARMLHEVSLVNRPPMTLSVTPQILAVEIGWRNFSQQFPKPQFGEHLMHAARSLWMHHRRLSRVIHQFSRAHHSIRLSQASQTIWCTLRTIVPHQPCPRIVPIWSDLRPRSLTMWSDFLVLDQHHFIC